MEEHINYPRPHIIAESEFESGSYKFSVAVVVSRVY